MKILLTGATGNVGGQVLPLLLERGYNVRCLVFDSKSERRIVNKWRQKPELVWADIRDRRAVESAVREVDAVIHLAAIIPPMTEQNPTLAYGVNVTGTKNLVEATGKQPGNVKFIFTSTYDVYGNTQDQTPPRKVILPVNPQEEYARHKVEAETIIQNGNVNWCIFRLASAIPVGMSMKYQSMMFDVPLDDRLEYIHPADAALALCNAVEHPMYGAGSCILGADPVANYVKGTLCKVRSKPSASVPYLRSISISSTITLIGSIPKKASDCCNINVILLVIISRV